MSRPFPAGWMVGAALFSVALQRCGVAVATHWWPALSERVGGGAAWVQASPVLAGCTGLLVAAWHRDQLRDRITGGWLAVLVGLPLLLAVGVMAAGAAQTAADFPYLPGRGLVASLFGATRLLLIPIPHLVCAVPGPLLLLAWWGSWSRRLVFCLSGTALSVLLVVMIGRRCAGLGAARLLLAGDLQGLLPAVQLPGSGALWCALVLSAGVFWSRPPQMPRVGLGVWVCGALLAVDPVPVMLGWFLPRVPVAMPAALEPLSGLEFHRGSALVDLTAGDVRLDGVVVDATQLQEGLVALGHPVVGRGALALSMASPQPWGRRLRAGVRLALPGSATIGDVAGLLARLTQHGIGEVHWIGGGSVPVTGTMRRAFEQPAFTVMLDVPVDRALRIEVPWAWLSGEGVRLYDPVGRCGGEFTGPGWLDELDAALVPCRDGVVFLPAADVELGLLTRVLDRVGGPGRSTMGAYRVGIVPPGPVHEHFQRQELEP